MDGRLATLATRYAGRPLLMTSTAAFELATRLRAVDSQAFERPGRIAAVLRALAGKGRDASAARLPAAMEDGDYDGPAAPPLEQRLAYAPMYAGDPEDIGFCWTLNQGVALMQCDTPIADRGEEWCGVVYHGYDTLLAGMQEAAGDERVRAIFLRAFSPGGVCTNGIFELAAWMRANRAKAGGKPIWIYADMAASAMYWIAASADKIVSGPVGLVGSLGVVIVHENYAGMMEKTGIAIETVEFPEGGMKTDGAWWKSLSPTARADLQAELNQCGAGFVGDVCAGRPNLKEADVLAMQARVFMSANADPEYSALARGLIDEIMSESEAFAALVMEVTPAAQRTPSTTAPAATATAPSGKEKTMSRNAQALAAAKLAAKTANAEVKRLEAAAAAPAAGETTETTAATGDDETDVADEAGEGTDTDDETEGDTEQTVDAANASAEIAKSPEAEAHPAHALAAIRSGMTLEQFRASIAASKSEAPGLRGQMQGARRLGPAGEAPAPAATATADALNPARVYGKMNAPKAKKAAR